MPYQEGQQKQKNNSSRKKMIFISVVVLVIIFTGLFCKWAYDNYWDIQDLKGAQNKLDMDIGWKANKSKAYIVTIYNGEEKIDEIRTGRSDISVLLRKVEVKYTVKVRSAAMFGSFFDSETTVKTHKLEQVLSVGPDPVRGFTDGKIKVKSSAKTDISYVSQDPKLVKVNEKGKVTFLEPGETKIEVHAAESGFYKPVSMTIDVTIYPEALETPEIEISDKSSAEAKITWGEIPYAKEYEIAAYSPWTKDYEVIAVVKNKEKRKAIVPKNDAAYKIKAKAKLLGRMIESDWSEVKKTESYAHTAKSYSEYHDLGVMDSKNVEPVAAISGPGGTDCPQSFSYTGRGYMIAYSNHSGKTSALVEYDSNGKYVRSEYVKMGHGNGSTYNPDTNLVYALKQHNNKSKTCKMFDYETLEEKGKFKLPFTASGISYDATTGDYYLSGGNKIKVADSDFKIKSTIKKLISRRYNQDVGAGNGVALACSWNGGKDSYVDIYRASDGCYLGTYRAPLGEIESATIVDKYLVMLFNNANGTGQDMIYRSKKRLSVL